MNELIEFSFFSVNVRDNLNFRLYRLFLEKI